MVNVSVMGDDLLDDRRPDFRLWWWRWRWRQRSHNGRGRALTASNDDLVLDDFALWRGLAASDYELLALSRDQLSAGGPWGGQTPLAATNDQRVLLDLALPAMAALLAVFVAEGYLLTLFASGVVSFSEPDLVPLKLDFSRSGRASSAAEGDLLALDGLDGGRARSRLLTGPNRDVGLVSLHLSRTTTALAAADVDLLSFHLPHAGGGWRSAADDEVLLDVAAASGAPHDLFVQALAHDERAST